MKLDANDQWHLIIASGWLEIDDWLSANDELDKISPPMQEHLDVLKLRVAIYCKARRFDLAAPISDALAEIAPEDPQFWLNRAVALCQLERRQEAQAAIIMCFDLKPDLLLAAIENPDLATLWTSPPA